MFVPLKNGYANTTKKGNTMAFKSRKPKSRPSPVDNSNIQEEEKTIEINAQMQGSLSFSDPVMAGFTRLLN